ncbi:MAG: polysaccharide biosynthesis/export family protein [Hyphomonadaceae bacterium]
MLKHTLAAFAACLAFAFAPAAYSQETQAYRLGAGDTVEVAIYSAPELTRTSTIAPDGALTLPLVGPVRAAGRTTNELQADLIAAYAPHLRSPEIEVSPRTFASNQIYVGGEVGRPGAYDMAGQLDPLQAIVAAGGFLTTSRRREVWILSRLPNGETSVRAVDLSHGAMRRGLPGLGALSRYDVIYVPRSGIANVNLFMQQYVRDALPIQFSLFYDLRGDAN